jgi:hypothetical protein
MEGATNLSEVETAWSDFLDLSQRIHSKLEQGAKGQTKGDNWWGAVKHNRRTNPILRYTHHARNVDHHGLAPITDRDPATLALGVGPGAWSFEGQTGPGGELKITALGGQVPGESKFVELKPESVKLVRVVDRGVSYDPPLEADGNPLTPVKTAQLTLESLTKIVEEAKQLPTHS